MTPFKPLEGGRILALVAMATFGSGCTTLVRQTRPSCDALLASQGLCPPPEQPDTPASTLQTTPIQATPTATQESQSPDPEDAPSRELPSSPPSDGSDSGDALSEVIKSARKDAQDKAERFLMTFGVSLDRYPEAPRKNLINHVAYELLTVTALIHDVNEMQGTWGSLPSFGNFRRNVLFAGHQQLTSLQELCRSIARGEPFEAPSIEDPLREAIEQAARLIEVFSAQSGLDADIRNALE